MTARLYDHDFGWFQRPGEYGQRLSYSRDTGILYVFSADPFAPQRQEPLAAMSEERAASIGERWATDGPLVLIAAGLR